MSWVAVAVGGAAVIGGVVATNSANQAANSERDASNSANQLTQGMYNNNVRINQPWVDSGRANLDTLNADMPDLTRQFTMQDFHADPGYQFDLAQGQQAMQRSAAAKGMLNSMGTQQNLSNYSQGMASNEFSNAQQRFAQNQTQKYNMLAGMAGNGQTAIGQITQAGTQAGNQMSNNVIGAGNAQAAGQIASGNAINGTLQSGVNGYMNYNMMQQLMNKNGQLGTASPVSGNTGGGYSMPVMGSSAAPTPGYSSALGTYDF